MLRYSQFAEPVNTANYSVNIYLKHARKGDCNILNDKEGQICLIMFEAVNLFPRSVPRLDNAKKHVLKVAYINFFIYFIGI